MTEGHTHPPPHPGRVETAGIGAGQWEDYTGHVETTATDLERLPYDKLLERALAVAVLHAGGNLTITLETLAADYRLETRLDLPSSTLEIHAIRVRACPACRQTWTATNPHGLPCGDVWHLNSYTRDTAE